MTKKIGISLPDDLYVWMQSQVDAGNADSVSGLITDVLTARRQLIELEALVADMVDEFGEPDSETVARIDTAVEAARELRDGHRPFKEGGAA